jgi:predicted nucleic acid-binding protein
MVVLDTNIIIDHLRQSLARDTANTMLQSLAKTVSKSELAISTITVQELYEGKSTKSKEMEAYFLTIISALRILPYDFETAQKAGEIARDIGRSIELPDAAIAATTILNSAQLLTLNQKDFRDIPDLQLASV